MVLSTFVNEVGEAIFHVMILRKGSCQEGKAVSVQMSQIQVRH